MPKRSLRQQMLARRRAISHEEWQEASRSAQLQLLTLAEYARAGCIALYAPAHNEIDTALILADAFAAGKKVLYPAVCGQEMVLRHVTGLECLQRGCFGILEPCPTGEDHLADQADLFVVPGVVFDRRGHRIGYGKGFYDRFLRHPGRTAHLVGLCHDFQLIDGDIPADGHDIQMEIIVTDRRMIRSKDRGVIEQVDQTSR
ncbi:5-formyltetrahydrofolate cyclo-ligase [Geobacter sp. SVR]|uniref:5-formyltetrahydrofolate cyclo-ligase n=1 Tax=Geobacter sp. SVR TaxID=2495594 RepID=UPI00143F0135|nr:5-formyltetrahydrofolate cyclo-ligase [Geobacter sp. SVR]BCS56042.1 5-formyltetrahydrofolate cyclo-ligase [Geobacter sp. SVR]GCF84805.1 5-formyltetrahydrofolate cyclo-ligase [Geobacter sp. SVR]